MMDEEVLDIPVEENTELSADGASNDGAEAVEQVFVDSFQLLSIIESLLFASDRPVSIAAFKQVFVNTNIDVKRIKKALEELQVICADPSRGVVLEEVTGGWQFRTKMDNMDFLKRITKARPFRLSGPALEVLSIIAYKQPIVKNEVDQIRGVESGHLVRALMEKGLVTFEGKTDLPGKPMAYATTKKFLEIFGLRNLNELPTLSEIDQLLPDGIGDEVEKETLSDVTAMMSTAIGSTYSEGEEELLNIAEKIQSIDTSSEFFEEEKRRQKAKKDKERAEDIREAMALGEPVENKDVKWLERYEASLLAPVPEVKADDAVVLESSSTEIVMEEPIGETVIGPTEISQSETEEPELLFEPTIKESFVEGDELGEEIDPEDSSESFT